MTVTDGGGGPMKGVTGQVAPSSSRWRIERGMVGLAPVVRALLDAIVLVVFLRVIEIFFFGPHFYEQLGFHPFWLVVLLSTLQSGLFAGVAAAIIATLAKDWPVRPMGVDIVEHYIDISMLPLLWLLTALLLGLFRGAEMRERATLETALTSANADKQLLAEELAAADAALDRAEIDAITRSGRRPNMVVQALGDLASDRAGPDIGVAFEAASAMVSPRPCLLLLARQGRLEVVAGDETARGLFAEPISQSALLTEAAEKPGLSILESVSVKPATHGRLVLAPVRDGRRRPRAAVVVLAEDAQSAEQARPAAALLAGQVKQRFGAGTGS